MRQADIQRMRRVLAEQITNMHSDKLWVKENIRTYWIEATPDTNAGRHAFHKLNEFKDYLRAISQRIEKLSLLIKALKKEERALKYK